MLNKPFKCPVIRGPTGSNETRVNESVEGPPAKRQRQNGPTYEVNAVRLPKRPSLNDPVTISACDGIALPDADGLDASYTVLWRKFTAKKHKVWDGDGVLTTRGGFAHLRDISGKQMGKIAFNSPLLPGSTLSIAGKEVEVDSVLTRNEARDEIAPAEHLPKERHDSDTVAPKVGLHSRPFKKPQSCVTLPEDKSAAFRVPPKLHPPRILTSAPKSNENVMRNRFKNPLLSNNVLTQRNSSKPTPRHDPCHAQALVMSRLKSAPRGKQTVDVVVDPVLCKHLREHQREGVKFMYECVMSMRAVDGQGAILADEMGLGKTLQTIALLWTLLKQNPVHGDAPVIRKALIVCPVTLINNWRKEFRKWLGNEVIGVYVADDSKKSVRSFTLSKAYSVMIIGYEKLRNVQDDLRAGNGIDLVVADEGHRLKTAKNKSAEAIKSLNTFRRIILSGTPIQNDLSEFFEMVDFVNPGILGKYSVFRKRFETPILKSRQPSAQQKDIEHGEEMSQELAGLTKPFILRRTAEILSKYLPPKTEYVLFCKPTSAQARIYRAILSSPVFGNVLGSPEASLQLITTLKKVCNSPTLIAGGSMASGAENSNVSALLSSIPSSISHTAAIVSSTKLRVLDALLKSVRSETSEKVVLVSNYTSMLDILQSHLTANSLSYVRMDGSTPASKRQDIVDRFNRTPANVCFAFLLSAKSGGAGLNLIGASRLVLFDADWNPSTDLQAMARIHRDGQKREVHIYRLLVGGALDEKVWQRQITKTGLADSVMDQKSNTSSFSTDELRNLFILDSSSACQTHDLLGCSCGGNGTGTFDAEDIDMDVVLRDDDEEFPEIPPLVRASDIHQKALDGECGEAGDTLFETNQRKQNALKMQSLMKYAHIDTSKFGMPPAARSGTQTDVIAVDDDDDGDDDDENSVRASIIGDNVLLSVLRSEENRVQYVFAKTFS
ncbi:MAG: hypothetical protein M1825_004672 [Sarcosagium campestre]|nr:MAG: hypothetical protein M1825_004672 [Sarcosagium campestre]